MNSQDALTRTICLFHPNFPDQQLALGLKCFSLKTFNAKDIVLQQGKTCEYLLFPESSVTRCFYLNENGEEKTIWMEPERMFITDFESFINGTPSRNFLQFYEKTNAWVITRKDLLLLYENHRDWAVFGIRMMEDYHVRILDLFTTMFRNDASENYAFVEQHFGKFLNVAPLKDVASMLNLSPVSLSRIRAGRQTRK
jgi:CRP-like cAMP-binding protein